MPNIGASGAMPHKERCKMLESENPRRGRDLRLAKAAFESTRHFLPSGASERITRRLMNFGTGSQYRRRTTAAPGGDTGADQRLSAFRGPSEKNSETHLETSYSYY